MQFPKKLSIIKEERRMEYRKGENGERKKENEIEKCKM